MIRYTLVLAVLLFSAGLAGAAPKKPVRVFDNISTVGAVSATYDTRLFPDEGSWELVVNGGPPTTYTVAIQGSIRCVNGVAEAGSFHNISEINQTDVHLRHIAWKPVRCFRAIIDEKTGGGSFDVYYLPKY